MLSPNIYTTNDYETPVTSQTSLHSTPYTIGRAMLKNQPLVLPP